MLLRAACRKGTCLGSRRMEAGNVQHVVLVEGDRAPFCKIDQLIGEAIAVDRDGNVQGCRGSSRTTSGRRLRRPPLRWILAMPSPCRRMAQSRYSRQTAALQAGGARH